MEAYRSSVGKSHRTPFKHCILDKVLGSVAGRVGRGHVKFIWGDFHVVDLCAGDGEPGAHGLSSPEIVAKHCSWVQSEFRNRDCWSKVKATLIEMMPETFESLSANVLKLPGGFDLDLRMEDARNYRVSAGKNEAVFVNADPNTVHSMPLADELVQSFPQFTTMTLTLGCNAHGIKRNVSYEDRQEWYGYVEMLSRALKSYHDIILCRVIRDSHQWAYMSVVPKKDTPKQVQAMAREGARQFEHGVEVCTYRDSQEAFTRMLDGLFLTKRELESQVNAH